MTANGSAAKPPLQTVDRALEVLLSYSERRRDWGVLELAAAFDVDKSTAQRILAALAARGFLHADPVTRRYSLGPTMWRMAALWERTGGLGALAQQVLEPLAMQTDRTALFAVPDGLHVRCVAAVDGGGPLRSHPLVSELYPANTGATSRAYFAFLDSNERRALISGRVFAKFTELSTVDEAELERLFVETAAQGYAYSDGEYDYATRALAVPILLRGRPVGSLSLGESKYPARTDDICDHLPTLQSAAEQLTALLDSTTAASAARRRQATPRAQG